MAARVLDGKALAAKVRQEVAERVRAFTAASGVRPCLAAVLVGDDPASHVYVRTKRRACEQVGMTSRLVHLPATSTTGDVLRVLEELNEAPDVHGILVQLPLPEGIETERVIESIDPTKDVDGFHPYNYGLLAAGRPRFVPCTPLGIQRLLVHYGIRPAGRHVVILGRSHLVGRPLALLLVNKAPDADATVTICHSRTPNLADVTRRADILVVAIGRPRFVTASMVRPGAVVVDVGINRVDDRLVGDVEYESVCQVAEAITPVPGGVGPMTVAMLLHNTLLAAELQVRRA